LLELLRQQQDDGAGPAQLAQNVLEHTGYAQLLEDEDSVEGDARLENLREVLGSLLEFEREAEQPTLSAFLELVTLQTDNERGDDGEAITLMTVHAAKGLEFPVVMVAGLEEETFPSVRRSNDESEEDASDVEEERRLAYVAFTRAKQRLFLSYAQTRRVYGELKVRRPSRFLQEMPQQELEIVGRERSGAGPRRAAVNAWGTAAARRSQIPGDSHVDRSEASDPEGTELQPGMRVRHQKFGIGQVCAITPGIPARVTVRFPGWGDKTLVSSYLEPA
jgi:DNA helicase-2/ATP-dependent DNA helicase PcrA